MKKTSASYNKNKYILIAIILYTIIILIDIIIIFCFPHLLKSDLANPNNIAIIFVCFMFFSITVVHILGKILGIIKGIFTKAKIRNNPDNNLYLRSLPNNFGIGVTTLLFDSKIENYKDIVAVILDLCARKYLSLIKDKDKYLVKVLKKIDDKLLENEKYIMELLINNDIKNIDYYKWYSLCENDGINLGLYYRINTKIDAKNIDNLDDLLTRIKKKSKIFAIIIFIISFIALFFSSQISDLVSNISTMYSRVFIICLILIIVIFLAGSFSFLTYFLTYFVLYLWETLITMIKFLFNIGDVAKKSGFNDVMSNNLIRTKHGEDEYQKLVSFKNFIKDFGAFASREAKEIVIWDRYLSYAHVFGLTKEIMQTGYKELIDNASFQIDNIDNVNIDNIEILL